ncbi:MAG: hypothetical protein LBS25_03905, partial [Candidatus Symbiothrix sp.]|nr:hypothetical protein [Candidatus Symbiothrix sp.]
MKKLKLFSLSALALSLIFIGCGPEPDNPNVDNIVEDGFYVVGEATAIANLTAEGASKTIMAVGFNEVLQDGKSDEEKVSAVCQREGMYEKYIALEGGKPFSLVLKEGKTEIKYGATLQSVNLADENGNSVNDQPAISIYKGTMTENATLQVEESGLYHIVLDLNLNNDLSDKLILIAPVKW